MKPIKLKLLLISVALMATSGCLGSGSASPESEIAITKSVRVLVGTQLIAANLDGVKGASPKDQAKIDKAKIGVDNTVTRICAAGIWSNPECIRYDEGGL